jgi:putative addiction module CopG family antidote
MRTTRQMSITLPNEMADAVRERVEAGGYASESEVIRDGIRSLLARDAAIERWLREDVAAAAQTLDNDPRAARTIEDVRARLAQLRGDTA